MRRPTRLELKSVTWAGSRFTGSATRPTTSVPAGWAVAHPPPRVSASGRSRADAEASDLHRATSRFEERNRHVTATSYTIFPLASPSASAWIGIPTLPVYASSSLPRRSSEPLTRSASIRSRARRLISARRGRIRSAFARATRPSAGDDHAQDEQRPARASLLADRRDRRALGSALRRRLRGRGRFLGGLRRRLRRRDGRVGDVGEPHVRPRDVRDRLRDVVGRHLAKAGQLDGRQLEFGHGGPPDGLVASSLRPLSRGRHARRQPGVTGT